MHLLSIASAVPGRSYTQRECWEVMQRSPSAQRLTQRSMALMERVLTGDSGIERRNFALGEDEVFELDAEALNRAFEREAPALGARALAQALDRAGLRAADLDGVYICTCTGYLCPGLSSHVAERLGMRADALLHDVVGLGCGAAVPTLRLASHQLAAQPHAKVAVVAVEVCSAAFFLDNDAGVLISACLFGDGASASIWTGNGGPGWRADGFGSLHIPENRELLRFENCQGKLRNRLHRSVPLLAADAVQRLFEGGRQAAPDHVLAHTGGRDVLAAIRERLPAYPLDESYAVLREHGNMSSPSVLFALERFLDGDCDSERADDLWLTAFGAGFSAHCCRLRWGDQAD